MGYFPNASEADAWQAHNCRFCVHAKDDGEDADMCPVMTAHILFSYDLCNETDHPGKVILDLLIPEKKASNSECAMLVRRNGITEQHLRDWQKYKAAMQEMVG